MTRFNTKKRLDEALDLFYLSIGTKHRRSYLENAETYPWINR